MLGDRVRVRLVSPTGESANVTGGRLEMQVDQGEWCVAAVRAAAPARPRARPAGRPADKQTHLARCWQACCSLHLLSLGVITRRQGWMHA